MSAFYIYISEDLGTLDMSPEGSQCAKLKIIPARTDKILIKVKDRTRFKPEDFKPGGKYIHLLMGEDVLVFNIDPYSMELLEQAGDTLITKGEDNTLKVMVWIVHTNSITILENITDEEARLYYEVN